MGGLDAVFLGRGTAGGGNCLTRLAEQGSLKRRGGRVEGSRFRVEGSASVGGGFRGIESQFS